LWQEGKKMRGRVIPVSALAVLVVSWLALNALPAVGASAPADVTIHTLRSDTDTWSATGAISDSGPFVDPTEFIAGSSAMFHATRTFSGEEGTFTAVATVRIVPSSDPDISFTAVGRWAVTSGTGAYSGMHGGGSVFEEFVPVSESLVGTWTGQVVFA
jgi:hypothetical protein